jgi:hypothetical protein
MRGRLAYAAVLTALIAAPLSSAESTAESAYQGPTEADIRAAYQSKLDWINTASHRFLDEEAAAKVQISLAQLTFVECNPIPDQPENYLCSVLVEARLGDADTKTKRVELVMLREGNLWRVR